MESNKTYILKYVITFKDGRTETHETKVKNCMNELFSKVKLGKWIDRKYPDHTKLNIYSCTEDVVGNLFESFFGKGGSRR